MTTTFARHLELVPDDSMEVSLSPAGNQYDDEVLIDYDDYGTATHTEDEHMIEDGELMRPGTATDDMMEDAEPIITVNEEIMHDDPLAAAPEVHIEDEELIDYSDEDYQDDIQVTLDDPAIEADNVAESGLSTHEEIVTLSEPVDDAIVEQLEHAAAGENSTEKFLSAVGTAAPSASADDEESRTDAGLDQDETSHAEKLLELEQEPDGQAEDVPRQADQEEEAAAEVLGAQAVQADEPDTQASDDAHAQQSHGENEGPKAQPRFPAGLDTAAYFAPDGPQTPSDTGIHPITVRYGDIVMPLFKSRDQPDGLLKNDNLASVSLGDLLDNCRHRLAVKIGEDVSADQDLVLSFENMGLQVVEVRCHCYDTFEQPLTVLQQSSHAFGTSLDDVLEVYLSLHRNDSTQPIPPLALSLSLQLKFTSSLNILRAAAEQGDGMSKFAFFHNGTEDLDSVEEDEEEDEGHEQYEGQEVADEEQLYAEEGISDENHANGEAFHTAEGQEYEEDQDPEDPESIQEPDGEQFADVGVEGTTLEEYDEQCPADSAAELDHSGNNDETVEENATAAGELQHSSPEPALEDQLEGVYESEEHVRSESTASSATVRGDTANDSTGEFNNEDFIDFEDDDLTPWTTELHVDDGNDDFSALGADETDAVVQDTEAAGVADEATELKTSPTQRYPDALDGAGAEVSGVSHETLAATVNVTDQHGQDEDPADNLDSNEGDLPDEDDEEFDPAFDLLEGHDFEDFAQDPKPVNSADGLEYEDDDIGFNDDVEEAVLVPTSPLGKRSFDEHASQDTAIEKPDSKRARS